MSRPDAPEARVQRAELLTATLAQVGAAPDLESALKALVRGAILLLRGKHALARLFDLRSEEPRVLLYVDAHAGAEIEVRRHPEGHLQPGTFGAQLRAGGPPILVDDFWTLDPARYTAYLRMREQGLRSSINVPIDAGGERIGSLHVDHPEPHFFTATDLAEAAALAAQAGAAIDRARIEAARQEAQRLLDAQNSQLAQRNAEAAALRELDQLKNEFIRSISHELRTPLTVMHGYAQQLHTRARTLDSATVERMAGTMLSSTTRLSRLLTDLLDFARLERGELSVHPSPVDLGPMLRELVADAHEEPGGGRVVSQIPDQLVVRADAQKMRQVVANLLDNALKYAPNGPIVLRALLVQPAGEPFPGSEDVTPATTEHGTTTGMMRETAPETAPESNALTSVRIEVEDWGPGIPVRERPRVWEKFFRGAAVAGLNVVPGGGVGLAVVKALVQAQGGQSGLDTIDHSGCRFWIEIPGAAQEPEAQRLDYRGAGTRAATASEPRRPRRAQSA